MSETDRPRILIVDDDESLLDALKRQLRSAFDVTTASRGKEAVTLVMSRGPYAVVLADLRMPEMDGVTLLYLLRQAAPETVRILLTGNADLDAAISAVNMGNIFRFLNKPCPSKVLLRALDDAVEQYRINTASQPVEGWIPLE